MWLRSVSFTDSLSMPRTRSQNGQQVIARIGLCSRALCSEQTHLQVCQHSSVIPPCTQYATHSRLSLQYRPWLGLRRMHYRLTWLTLPLVIEGGYKTVELKSLPGIANLDRLNNPEIQDWRTANSGKFYLFISKTWVKCTQKNQQHTITPSHHHYPPTV